MHKHLPQYAETLIANARRLRREMTDAERRIWSKLRNNQIGIKFRRQVPLGKYILDFYSARVKLCVELDGSQHYSENGKVKDEKRDNTLNKAGIEVLRFSDYDALTNTDGVIQAIYERVHEKLHDETPSQPSPKRGRG